MSYSCYLMNYGKHKIKQGFIAANSPYYFEKVMTKQSMTSKHALTQSIETKPDWELTFKLKFILSKLQECFY